MRHITQAITGLALAAGLVTAPALPMGATIRTPAGASTAHHGAVHAAHTVRVVDAHQARAARPATVAQDNTCFTSPQVPPGASASQGGDAAKAGDANLPDAGFVASVEGVTPDVLQQDLVAGRTLLQIAGGRYASAGDLATALLVNLKAKLGDAVAAGKLTSTSADAIYAQRHDAYTQLVVTPHPDFGPQRRPGQPGDSPDEPRPAADAANPNGPSLPGATAVACVAGVSPDALQQDLAAGQTVRQIAGDRYASADDLATALLVGVRTKLSYGVAGGQWTPDQADAIYARMHDQYVQLVAAPHPPLWPE